MISKVLQPGNKGNDVKELQLALKQRGHDAGTIDGSYGPKTTAAVQSFQSSMGMKPTGVADVAVIAALNAPSAPGSKPSLMSRRIGPFPLPVAIGLGLVVGWAVFPRKKRGSK